MHIKVLELLNTAFNNKRYIYIYIYVHTQTTRIHKMDSLVRTNKSAYLRANTDVNIELYKCTVIWLFRNAGATQAKVTGCW